MICIDTAFCCFCFRCITICYIAPIENIFFRTDKLQIAAGKILQLIVDRKLQVSLLIEVVMNRWFAVRKYMLNCVNMFCFSDVIHF